MVTGEYVLTPTNNKELVYSHDIVKRYGYDLIAFFDFLQCDQPIPHPIKVDEGDLPGLTTDFFKPRKETIHRVRLRIYWNYGAP
jgi:hypothetical protein